MLIVWYMFFFWAAAAATYASAVWFVSALLLASLAFLCRTVVDVCFASWSLGLSESMALEKQRHYETETLTQTNSKEKQSKPH